MPRYSEERKASVLKKLLPPLNQSVPDVAAQEGISEATLYNWRIAVREQRLSVPGSGKSSDNWSPQAKFAVVRETASMSEAELSEYCREKGLYPEQIAQWREACAEVGYPSAPCSDGPRRVLYRPTAGLGRKNGSGFSTCVTAPNTAVFHRPDYASSGGQWRLHCL